MLAALAACAEALSPLPPGLKLGCVRGREDTLAVIRRSVAAALGSMIADGIELIEVDFPPLIEKKTQFDDYSNIEVLDANRDFAMQLSLQREVVSVAPGGSLWVCFADDGEVELAREAWPGAMYATATQTSIAAAVSASGLEPLKPFGAWATQSKAKKAAAAAAIAPPAALHLVVQPGDGGPMEDWLNVELLKRDGIPLVCLNGALDKVTSGYYSNFLNPRLAQCALRFYSRFEQAYYCKPIGSGRGWLFRVYPEDWQLYRQSRDELTLVETYPKRPTPAWCSERLKLPQ